MVENQSVVEQAHELQIMAKEPELLKCVLPDKFVMGCIVAKLPPSWRNFATSLKHQRHEFSIENIIGSLDVEEKVRAKDKHWWIRGKICCQLMHVKCMHDVCT
jgi:hypothetical protein